MKLKTLFFIVISIIPLCTKAQTHFTENNHSASIHILGADYAYEHSLGKNFTLIGRAGLSGGWMWSNSKIDFYDGVIYENNSFYWLIVPVLGAETRYYYGFNRRMEKGRNITKNSANFLSVNIQNYIPYGLSSEGLNIIGQTIITPTWGLRRVWHEHWMFEFTTGLNFGFNYENAGFEWSPALNVRFGYAF